jgi:transposase-like protein
MTTAPNPYRGFRFPAEVIEHAVWLYHCFSLSLRDVGTIFAARGIVVSYENSRLGPAFRPAVRQCAEAAPTKAGRQMAFR